MRTGLLIGVLATALLLSGCSKAPQAGEVVSYAHYSSIAPQSAGEKEAAAEIGEAYAGYLRNSANSQKVVYRDGDKVKPQLIGYHVRAYTAKKQNGSLDTADVLVLGDTVTNDPNWERPGDLTLSGRARAAFVYELPTAVGKPLPTLSEGEKNAVAKAKAWFGKSIRPQKFERFDLSGYSFAYGQPGDEHWLLLTIRTDDRSMDSLAH